MVLFTYQQFTYQHKYIIIIYTSYSIVFSSLTVQFKFHVFEIICIPHRLI